MKFRKVFHLKKIFDTKTPIIQRQSNFELLRIIIMEMIIIHHGIVHGLGIDYLASWSKSVEILNCKELIIWGGINSLLIISVNVFILISGYFSINLKKKKIISLVIQLFIYTFFLNSLPELLHRNIEGFIKSSMFLSHSMYWFLIDYMIISFFAPMMNNFCNIISQKQLKLFIAFMLFVSCYLGFVWKFKDNVSGYSLFQFVTMYFIGRYLKIYDIKEKGWKSIFFYLLLSLIIAVFFGFFILCGMKDNAWKMTFYNNPLVIVSSIFFFLIFKNINLRSSIINTLSKSTLAIYLISSSSLSVYYYSFVSKQYLVNSNIGAIYAIVISMIIITAAAFMIDPIQRFLNCYFISKIYPQLWEA